MVLAIPQLLRQQLCEQSFLGFQHNLNVSLCLFRKFPSLRLKVFLFLLQVGLIIGKGGETIKNLQTKSGARIQVVIKYSIL